MGKNREHSKFPNAITVLDNGNVGIGTTSPSTKLDVNDANGIPLRFGDISAAITGQTAGYIGMSTSAFSGNNGDLVLYPRTSATSKILLMGGNVGVFTSSPKGRFDVYRAAGESGIAAIVISNGEGGGGRNWSINTEVVTAGDFAICQSTTNGGTPAPTSANTKFYISSTGSVGIGTTSPTERLHIVGGGNGPEIKLEGSWGSHYIRSYNDNFNFYVNSVTQAMRINNAGIVTIANQPSFSMWPNASATGPGVVPFGGTNYNDGGYFNVSTYRFTAPVAGRYFFSFYDNVFANSSAYTYFTFRVNGSDRGAYAYYSNKSVGNWQLVSFQQVIKLNAGDYVDVYNYSVDRPDYGSSAWGNFSGHLLG